MDFKTSLRFDPATLAVLDEIAAPYDGNRSLAVRTLVRAEAEKRGLWPLDARTQSKPLAAEGEVQHGEPA